MFSIIVISQGGGKRNRQVLPTHMELAGSSKSYLPRWRQQFPASFTCQDVGYSLTPKMEATVSSKLYLSRWRLQFASQNGGYSSQQALPVKMEATV
jgi:hypothetical protein